jgi:hypothetical protein
MAKARGEQSKEIKGSVTKVERKRNLAITGPEATAFANMRSTAAIRMMVPKPAKGQILRMGRNHSHPRERGILYSWQQRKGRRLENS